jgi:hypothetical protein
LNSNVNYLVCGVGSFESMPSSRSTTKQHPTHTKSPSKPTEPSVVTQLGFDNVMADGVLNESHYGVALDFLHDVGAMRFRRLGADLQGHADFLIAATFRQKLHDFSLTAR